MPEPHPHGAQGGEPGHHYTQPDDTAALFEEHARTGDRHVRNELIVRYRWVAVHCSKRFVGRGVAMADLLQVAQLGVLRAVERFDPEYGVNFPTFAIPTVLGELRRHFRDQAWTISVPRRFKDACLDIGTATDRLAQRLGRMPSVDEVAAEVRSTPAEVRAAMAAGQGYSPSSLDRVVDDSGGESWGMSYGERLASGAGDPLAAEQSLITRDAMRRLPERQRELVYLRYYEDLTQQQIADVMGISQVHVSRLLRVALAALRRAIEASGSEAAGERGAMAERSAGG
jgi:RNA polymerase sigma-B factor